MPNAIADTTCIQYLYQVELLDLLPQLYGKVTIPTAVSIELLQGKALGISLPDVTTLSWLAIAQVPVIQLAPTIPNLGMGEREVISLSQLTPNSLAILDDGLARIYATQLNVLFTGTLGILLKAKQLEHITTLKPILTQLDVLGFHLDAATKQTILKLAKESP